MFERCRLRFEIKFVGSGLTMLKKITVQNKASESSFKILKISMLYV